MNILDDIREIMDGERRTYADDKVLARIEAEYWAADYLYNNCLNDWDRCVSIAEYYYDRFYKD